MKNLFNLSHYKNFTSDMGQLVPIMLHEVLPGDIQQHYTDILLRVSPLNTPVMHPVQVKIHHFYVPTRLVWDDFEDFITGGDDGNNASVHPQITLTPAEKTLADYLGLPIGTSISISALPFRVYAKIWNEHYRDPDLETELTIDTTSGADSTTNTTLQNCAWEKDFFTTCRATEQKGSDVLLPLGTEAPIKRYAATSEQMEAYRLGTDTLSTNGDIQTSGGGIVNDGTYNLSFNPAGQIYADLTNATSATVNELKKAFAEQRFKQARSRYGNRYTEYLNWLGVNSPDGRLQRSEYLGGGKSTISFSEIVQSGPDFDSNDGVGTLRGHGISALRSNSYKKFFTEHGYVMSFMSVRPRTMYVDGVPHEWAKTTKEEYFQREYQHTGQRAVKNSEVYAAHTSPADTFGYQDRYDEYRKKVSTVAGEFRSTLDEWHMARKFSSDPALNATFVKANPTNRIYASTSTNQLQCMAYHSLKARRLLDKKGN
jgi:hypothetical protein